MVKEVNETEFTTDIIKFTASPEGGDWEFQGDKPAVIDFYAPWCGPCIAVGPVLNELSEEYEGRVDFYKINVDENKTLSMSFGIQSIPAILLVNTAEDSEPMMIAGAIPKEGFVKAIEKEFFGGE